MKKTWRNDLFNNNDDNQLYEDNVKEPIDIFEEDDEEIDDIKEQKMLKNLDSDLVKYFSEARVGSKKKITNKKSKKEKAIFNVGEKIKVNNIIGSVIYGPYENKDGKTFYEIETNDGIISIEDKGNNIQKI